MSKTVLLHGLCIILLALPAMGRAQTPRPAPAKPLWIAVAAPGFVKTIEPLARRRAGEGFEIQILDDTKLRTDRQRAERDVEPIRARVRELTGREAHPPSAVRNGGQSPPAVRRPEGPNAAQPPSTVTARPAVLVLVGFEPGLGPAQGGRRGPANEFALPGGLGSADNMAGRPSDAVTADLDGDGRPDVSIGRLPALDEGELKQMIAKIERFESQTAPAAWQHRFVLLGGSPDYGVVLDKLIETMVTAGLDRLDGRWQVRLFYDNATSVFNLPAGQLAAAAVAAMSDGAALNVYMGHSSEAGFFLRQADLRGLKVPVGAGPLIALSCSGGVQDPGSDGFAVTAMRNGAGPVATFAAGGISYPQWNKLLAEGLEKALFNGGRPARLAQVIDGMLANLATAELDLVTLAALNIADGSKQDYPAQRRGHLAMYSLFGDPATRLPWMPALRAIALAGPERAAPGQTVRLVGRLDDRRLDGAKVAITVRRPFGALPALVAGEDAAARFARVSRVELALAEATVAAGRFEATVALAADSPGEYVVVRAWAVGREDLQAVGSCRIGLVRDGK